MYCFQASLPLSLPPPVSFSPPKAPPISAPLVPMLQLTMPQSEPDGPIHLNRFCRFFVKIDDERPYLTELLYLMPSSRSLILNTYMIGQKLSVLTMSASGLISTIVGST